MGKPDDHVQTGLGLQPGGLRRHAELAVGELKYFLYGRALDQEDGIFV